jgi:hypothetical protein
MFPISSTTPLNPLKHVALSNPPSKLELQQRKKTTKNKASIAALEKSASHQN